MAPMAPSLKPSPMAALPLQWLPFHIPPPLLKKPLPMSIRFNSQQKARILRLIVKANGEQALLASNNGGSSGEESERPPFNLNLAVVLAGFAFEAYASPPKNVGWREIDAAECQTVFLSERFLREVYDGQLFVKIKRGVDFPAMDPWGTSDPYVVLQLDSQVAKTKVKWGTKEPIWDEDFTLNIKVTQEKFMQVAAWDANLVTPHKRMGNAGVNVASLCDGDTHEVMVELEGIGGGGKVYLEVKYKSYDDIIKEKEWWRIPFVSDFFMKANLGSALRMAFGSESVNARQFVESAFGQLKSFNYSYLPKFPSSSNGDVGEGLEGPVGLITGTNQFMQQESNQKSSECDPSIEQENTSPTSSVGPNRNGPLVSDESTQGDKYFWKMFADIISQNVLQKLGFSLPEIPKWDGFDLLNKMNVHSQKIAEEGYIESGLATPGSKNDDVNSEETTSASNENVSSPSDIKKASRDILNQTDAIFGALMVLTSALSQQKKDGSSFLGVNKDNASAIESENKKEISMNEKGDIAEERFVFENQEAEQMRELFSSAESAMEAWAMLATSLGCKSFIKSEFEKICFLDNDSTDTQVAIWRDSLREKTSGCLQRY
ncbi:C2 domain-containing protein [Dioscorea alata]|uniref:C2 domain-containing protein n=1 Tax=Dioscorea alata TaxID=55571 RepID=A0ACB7WR53_DIOAL|nr:C2 domain-containing protein [Dioscorea alata]